LETVKTQTSCLCSKVASDQFLPLQYRAPTSWNEMSKQVRLYVMSLWLTRYFINVLRWFIRWTNCRNVSMQTKTNRYLRNYIFFFVVIEVTISSHLFNRVMKLTSSRVYWFCYQVMNKKYRSITHEQKWWLQK